MRVYFNLVRGQQVIPDEQGIDVADLAAARAEAVAAIAELLRQDPSVAADWAGWRLDVTDPFGAVVFSIDLGAAVP